MRRAILGVVVMALAASVPGMAQEAETFQDSFRGAPPLTGYVDEDAEVVVLDDRSFCSYVLGSAFGSGTHISTDILRWELQDRGFNRRSVNRAIREYGTEPVSNEGLLDACEFSISQFKNPELSYFEWKYPDDPEIAEIANKPPEWQAMPVVAESVWTHLQEGE